MRGCCDEQNLSDDEQRVCILREVSKFKNRSEEDGDFFSWLGGFSVTDQDSASEAAANSSVDELWTRLFQFERDK